MIVSVTVTVILTVMKQIQLTLIKVSLFWEKCHFYYTKVTHAGQRWLMAQMKAYSIPMKNLGPNLKMVSPL